MGITENSGDVEQPRFDATSMIELRRRCDLSLPYAVRAAVTLRLPENLLCSPATTAELADRTGTKPWALGKLLARLGAEGLVRYSSDDGTWSITPEAEILTSDHVRTALDERSGHAHLDRAWPGLLHTLRTGESGYEKVTGVPYWSSVADDPTLGESFDVGLSRWASQWSTELANLIGADFGGHVVDVGGGIGQVLRDVLVACPAATGALVELPSTAARARAFFDQHELADRTTCVEQSFFEQLPGGGQIYLLTQVLHDWPDAEAQRILRRLADVVADGRVLIVERTHDGVPDADESAFDLVMNVVFGGGERSQNEYVALATAAGLRLAANTPIGHDITVMEFRSGS